MRWILVISATAVLINLASSRSQGQTECMVTEKRTGEQEPCQFPFTVGGTTYKSCTQVTVFTNKQDGRKWCSNKSNPANPASLNENEGTIFGVSPHTWGACPEECLEIPETTKPTVSTCCDEVRIVGEGDAFKAYPEIFNTTYMIEPDLLNGRVHYTSLDGGLDIAFNATLRQWHLQDTRSRDKLLAFTTRDTGCPSEAGFSWQYKKDDQVLALDGLEVKCSYKADGSCRTVSHGKLERINYEGYRHILNVDNDNYYLHPENRDISAKDLAYELLLELNLLSDNRLKYSELGPGIPGKPCVFPFKVNGIEFNECTSYQSPYGWPRCATKESQDLDRPGIPRYSRNAGSSWGFCCQECPVEEDSCLVVSGDGSYEMCDFPFEYNGITYNECTWDWSPLLDPKDEKNFYFDEFLDFEDDRKFESRDAGAWCKWKNGDKYGRGKCGSNCQIPTKPEGDCHTLNGKPCQFSLDGEIRDACLEAGDPVGLRRLFPNQTNLLGCPISEEGEGFARKITRGFCSPRCPTLNGNSDCLNENTVIIYNDGEVYTGRFSIDEFDEFDDFDFVLNGSVSLYPSPDINCKEFELSAYYDYDWDT